MAQVVLESVVKRFGPDTAVAGLSFTVSPGQCLCLFGPSGYGKTTTLRLIAGLERPDSGRVLFDGEIVSGDGRFVPPQHRRVSMVFQDQALWPHFSAARHLDFVLKGVIAKKLARRARVQELLALVGLERKTASRPHALSGGERQRLAIARAIASPAKILLLDEPFSNLDAAWRNRLVEEFIRLKNEGKTLLVATHSREEAHQLADAALLMHHSAYDLVPPAGL